MKNKIHVIGRVQVPAELRPEFLSQVAEVAAESRQEAGNISYLLTENPDAPNTYLFIEEWMSRQALGEHMETEHFINFAKWLRDKRLDIDIDILEPIV